MTMIDKNNDRLEFNIAIPFAEVLTETLYTRALDSGLVVDSFVICWSSLAPIFH